MAKRLGGPILLGVVTVFAILLMTGDKDDKLDEIFEIGAVYEAGYIEVTFLDKSEKTDSSVLQVLGMKEPFHKTIHGSEFVERVAFPGVPKHGWQVHPIVLDISHSELGAVQLKTEVHMPGQAVPDVIYSRP